MRAADLPTVGLIEQRNYDFPWSVGIFRDCLKAGYTCRVLRSEQRIVGYGILQVAAGEAHLLNICVDAEVQHRGFARYLLEQLLGLATLQGLHLALSTPTATLSTFQVLASLAAATHWLNRSSVRCAAGWRAWAGNGARPVC